MDFALTGVEIIFLGVAVLVTIPMILLFRWVIREMRKEEADHKQVQDKPRPEST